MTARELQQLNFNAWDLGAGTARDAFAVVSTIRPMCNFSSEHYSGRSGSVSGSSSTPHFGHPRRPGVFPRTWGPDHLRRAIDQPADRLGKPITGEVSAARADIAATTALQRPRTGGLRRAPARFATPVATPAACCSIGASTSY
jgi:hypothetical protein